MTTSITPAQANPLSPAAGESAGRRVATQVGGPGPPWGDKRVEALARAGLPRLRQMGVDAEVVRSRPGCLVVRSAARPPGDAAWACAVVAGWLDALPAVAFEISGTVAESTCAARGSRSCIHTLIWRTPEQARAGTGGEVHAGAPTPGTAPLPPSATGANGSHGEPGPDAAGVVRTTATPLPPGGVAGAPPPPPPVVVPTETAWSGNPPALASVEPARPPRALAPATVLGPEATSAPTAPEPTAVLPEPTAVLPEPGPRTSSAARTRPAQTGAALGERRVPWLRRRAWLLVVGLLAGACGGYLARTHAGVGYSATAVLEVTSASSTTAASTAQGATELAVTYAALIPNDEALMAHVGAQLGMAPAVVQRDLSVQAESGTALVEVRFTDTDPSAARAGANDVARALSSLSVPGHAIATGSMTLVAAARRAEPSGALHKYGLPLGVLLGLVVGAGAVLVAERADRRVDDLDTLAAVAGCAATRMPGGISHTELARGLVRGGGRSATVVPLRTEDIGAACELARSLGEAMTSPAAGGGMVLRRVDAGPPLSVSPDVLDNGDGPTVLVVARGERVGAIEEAADRLRLVGRDPALAVLVRRLPPSRRTATRDGGDTRPRR